VISRRTKIHGDLEMAQCDRLFDVTSALTPAQWAATTILHYPENLTTSMRAVIATLPSFAEPSCDLAPTLRKLAAAADVSRPMIYKGLNNLIRLGFLIVTEPGYANRATRYRLILPDLLPPSTSSPPVWEASATDHLDAAHPAERIGAQ